MDMKNIVDRVEKVDAMTVRFVLKKEREARLVNRIEPERLILISVQDDTKYGMLSVVKNGWRNAWGDLDR